jgi:hypothetical protein
MKTKTRIWLGIGACVMAGSGAVVPGTASAEAGTPVSSLRPLGGDTDTAIPRLPGSAFTLAAAMKHGSEAGEAGEQGGEKGASNLPPDLDFALKVALIRGHLRVGDELVKAGQWAAALPHFLHPTEEIYGDIRAKLKDYKTPAFEAALKLLANLVKTKKGGDDYAKAMASVNDALAAADRGLKSKQADWAAFTVETALEVLKVATGEYKQAIVKKRIAKPVEYQDARGFVWQAEAMIDGVAADLDTKDVDALKKVRDGFAELKKTWPTATAPKAPVKDYGSVLSDVSRIELAAGKLM